MKNNHGRFSKRVLTAMVILWFAVAAYGVVVNTILLVIRPELINLGELYTFVGLPIAGGVTTYFIKSAWENSKKIENSSDGPESDEPAADELEPFDEFNESIEDDPDEY